MDKIKQALKTDTRPIQAKELPPNALCIPLTKQVCEYIETANDVMNRIVNLENNCNLASCRYNENVLEDKLLTEIMEKHYTEFGLNEENRYIFRDVVEKYGDMTYRHLCENYCFAFERE